MERLLQERCVGNQLHERMLLVSTARTHHLIGLRNAACLSGIVADCLVSANGVVNDPMATAPGPLSASASD